MQSAIRWEDVAKGLAMRHTLLRVHCPTKTAHFSLALFYNV